MADDYDINYIYLVTPRNPASMGPVKVGVTANLKKRIGGLQTASPYKLLLVHAFVVPDRSMALTIEGAFKTICKKYRLNGEWYDLTPYQSLELMTANILTALRKHYLEGCDEDFIIECERKAGIHEAENQLEELKSYLTPEQIGKEVALQ